MNKDSKSIAVIGCGWLGTPFAGALTASGYRVAATRSTPETVAELKCQGIDAIQLALRPALECSRLDSLKGLSIAVILLPPGVRNGCGHEFPEKISNLISGLKNIGITRMIFASSTSVYPSENREVDETETAAPDTESGQVLIDAEKRIMDDPDLRGTIIRFAGLCGPGREPGRLLSGRKNIPGGNNPVNLIHQQDAIGLLAALIHHRPWGKVFNGCAPLHPSKSVLYPRAAEAMGLEPPVFSSADNRFKIVRGDKVCRELDFVYRYPDPSGWR